MLNIDKTKYKIEFFDEEIDEFVGAVTNPTMNLKIYLKPFDSKFEKYGIVDMDISYSNDESSLANYRRMLSECPDELKDKFLDAKENLLNVFKKAAFISVDRSSLKELKKHNKYVTSFVYHELGHFVNSDKKYSETQNDRGKAILEGRVLEREQDADEYAYSVMGETFYDALREQERKFSKAAETETDPTFMMDLVENHLRAEHIAQIIIKEKS